RELVEVERAFELRHEMREALQEDGLHLHMKAAGIRRRASDKSRIDDRDLGALARQKTAGREADDAPADDEDRDLRQDRMRRRGWRGGIAHASSPRAMSAILTGFTGIRGAKRTSSSRGRPSRSASSCDNSGPQ